jgi:hypothetical protein
VFKLTEARVKKMRKPHDKSKETKTAARLRCSKTDRCDRKDCNDGSEDLSGCRADSQDNPNKWEENQMTRSRWYSPQMSREIVSRLYYKAKTEQIPMTVLVNRLIKQALDPDKSNRPPTANHRNGGQNAE